MFGVFSRARKPQARDPGLQSIVCERREMAFLQRRENVESFLRALKRSGEEELRLILVGKSGGGKSATGNTILDRREFESILTAKITTLKCQRGQGSWQGITVSVVDTPAMFDSDNYNEIVRREVMACIKFSRPGPHALILVTQTGRFTAEDVTSAKCVWDIFGAESARHTILLFTCVEDLGGDSLQEYVRKSDNKNLQDLIQQCGNRFCGFNNKAVGAERERQVLELMESVQTTVLANGGRYYVNQLYLEPNLWDEGIKLFLDGNKTARRKSERSWLRNPYRVAGVFAGIVFFIVIVIHFSGGGAERILGERLNGLGKEKSQGSAWEVTVCCLTCFLDLFQGPPEDHGAEAKEEGDDEELRLILVGKSGSGKSATGNTILGRLAFKSLVAAKASTVECQKEQGTWKKRKISVIDTPPIFDSEELEQSLKKQLENCRHMCQSGLHAFILVIQVGCFTAEDMAAAKHVWKIFGDESASRTIVLFTHKEDLEGDSLKNCIKNANNQSLCEVMKKCDHRLCGFNNKAEEDEREKQLSELMEMVEKIDKGNGGKPYFIPQGSEKTNICSKISDSPLSSKLLGDELQLILVGKSGGGKSATGNTILGRLAFKSLLATKPTTVEFQKEQGTCEGRKISVIDTPAIFDSKWLEESLAKDLENSLHVLIFVTQVGRFTAEDEAAAKQVWEIFKEESANRTIVLFTCMEDLGGDSLKNYVKGAKNKYLHQLIKNCNYRFCGFNNKAVGQERKKQVSELIEMVEEIVKNPREISPTKVKKTNILSKLPSISRGKIKSKH
ncbi:GTPase IMAP family member 8-like [Thamnophis elegans]|uniref:GTPase IMAP family member 8-like n=1 Tax=Thamnophis elegans TaxID=35005 RepID=UPI0013774AA2|nr:GTPase IMAP family member 8-like [Thamnophis elegans]